MAHRADPAPLSRAQIERYARHLVLKEIGGPGQQKLLAAKVLVIGAGGLGAPVLLYLAAAGVGRLGIVDDDRVALSNLQRQIIHGAGQIGQPKTASARAAIARLNPETAVALHPVRLTAANAAQIIAGYDLVADGSDNFATRLLVSDACYFARRPLVWAAVGRFEGQVSTFRPFETGEGGEPLASYRCLMPKAPPQEAPCAQTGILGALTGVVGSLQALEVIKEITGAGQSLAGRLLIYDALAPAFRIVRLRWDPDNPLTGRAASIRDLSGHR